MEQPVKLFRMDEVAKCNDRNETYIVIHNVVYDVTAFLDDHPGGEEVLLDQAGKDGTEAFEDIGHSTDAKDLMEKYKIGELVEEDRLKAEEKPQFICETARETNINSWKLWTLSVVLGAIATILYRLYFIEKIH